MKTKKTELTPEQQRVKKAIKFLKRYINTYESQRGYLNYDDTTIIDDILYGLGLALDEKKYSFYSGFMTFKAFLRKHLNKK